MGSQQAIQNTLERINMVALSFTIDALDVLQDVYIAGMGVYSQIRQVTSLKVVLAAPPGELEDTQMYWLSVLSDVLKFFERGRKLEALELEIVGFDEVANIVFAEELSSLLFIALELFVSSTIPHDLLTHFLSRHQSLRILSVGNAICAGRCPLSLETLSGLGSVHCAASCVSSILPRKPIHHVRVIDLARSREDYAPFMGVFVALRQSSMYLTRLEMTFPSTELEILHLVASAAPQLVHLALIEIEDPADAQRKSRRPWHYIKGWSTQLKQLHHLSYFRLKTSRFIPPKKKSVPDAWYPTPQTFMGTPESIEVWHNDGLAGVNVRHHWSLDDNGINYVYGVLEGHWN